MKKNSTKNLTQKVFILTLICLGFAGTLRAQAVCEWRLNNATFNPVDPDGAGPAIGSVSFTVQVHTILPGATVPDVTAISIGFLYQSSKAVIPSPPGCSVVNSPANVTVSPELQAGGFAYTLVGQCNDATGTVAGGQSFDRRTSGTLDAGAGSGIVITNTWTNMFTVTLWALSASAPQGGYVALNSSENGTPGPLSSYIISDLLGGSIDANSLSYNTPLALPSAVAPVLFSQFKATCSPTGTLISWKTAQESNSSYFEVERSIDGNTWVSLGRTAAAGNSSTDRSYNQIDLEGGNAMYRVKQVDKDGQFIYTGIERSNCQVKNITSLIYPVPAQHELNVVIKSDRALRTQLVIFDVTGRAVRRENVNIQNGTNNFKIGLTGLSAGEYLINSTNTELDLRKQFTIIR